MAQSDPSQFRNWILVGKGLIRRGERIAKGGESEVFLYVYLNFQLCDFFYCKFLRCIGVASMADMWH